MPVNTLFELDYLKTKELIWSCKHRIWYCNFQKVLKIAAVKNIFSSLYVIGATCFDLCFLFYVITGRQYFFMKAYRCCEVFLTTIFLLFWKKVFEKKSLFYTLYQQHRRGSRGWTRGTVPPARPLPPTLKCNI